MPQSGEPRGGDVRWWIAWQERHDGELDMRVFQAAWRTRGVGPLRWTLWQAKGVPNGWVGGDHGEGYPSAEAALAEVPLLQVELGRLATLGTCVCEGSSTVERW